MTRGVVAEEFFYGRLKTSETEILRIRELKIEESARRKEKPKKGAKNGKLCRL